MFRKKKIEPNPIVGMVYEWKHNTSLIFAHVTHLHHKLVVYDVYENGVMTCKSRMRSFNDFEFYYDTSDVMCLFSDIEPYFKDIISMQALEQRNKELKKEIGFLLESKQSETED